MEMVFIAAALIIGLGVWALVSVSVCWAQTA